MLTSKVVPVGELHPLNLRPVTEERVKTLKDSIENRGYDPSCPLIVQRNGAGYLVVNGCHRLRAAMELNIKELPVVEYPADEDPVRIALRTQENDEQVHPWDFLDKAFLVKKLYEELGTQEKVAERLKWERSNISRYLAIASLPDECVTIIRSSVTACDKNPVTGECDHGHRKSLDDIWSVRWFRHICALPNDELKLAVIKKIAENPEKWKEKEVASECAKLKKRHEVLCRIEELSDTDCDPDVLTKIQEIKDAVKRGAYDKQPEVAVERAQAVIKAGRRTDMELMEEWGYSPIPYDVWRFNGRDERFGVAYPGNIPAGIVFNVLYFFTKQGDLVVDPMAGGGVTGDVCRVMKRKCLMYDVNPARDDINKHNLEDGWPEDAANCDLVFLDPPYYKKKVSEYGSDSVSSYPKDKYLKFFEKLARDMRDAGVKKVAFLMSDYNDEEDPEENIFIWDYVPLFVKAGFVPIRHIMVPLTEQSVHPDIVIKFRQSKRLARLGRSLVIFVARELLEGAS